MKKGLIVAILCLTLIVAGGITAYLYLDEQEKPDYSGEMFVDRGDKDGYATMHYLYTPL